MYRFISFTLSFHHYLSELLLLHYLSKELIRTTFTLSIANLLVYGVDKIMQLPDFID